MTFHMDIIKECLVTWVHLKILETLMREPRAMSQRQLARLMGIPRATAHRALNDLGQTGLIKLRRVGAAAFWEIDKQGYLYETLRPILRGLGDIAPPMYYLKRLIRERLNLPRGYRCLIFGSTSQGNDEPSSDIDLAIILPRGLKAAPPFVANALEELQDLCMEKFSKRLTPVYIREKDFKSPSREIYRNIQKGVEILS